MKNIGFLSFGPLDAFVATAGPSAADTLLQSIELAVAAEEFGADGAYYRLHHSPASLPHPSPCWRPSVRGLAWTCTGEFVLAEAGLLDDRRATTHWHRARQLQARFPKVKVEEDRIFIIDGPVWTSAGITAGIDLALAMIEKDLGADVARTGQTIGGLSPPRRRPVAVLRTAGARAQIRPYPERAGLCKAQSHLEADG